jgi:hypothetical protein
MRQREAARIDLPRARITPRRHRVWEVAAAASSAHRDWCGRQQLQNVAARVQGQFHGS